MLRNAVALLCLFLVFAISSATAQSPAIAVRDAQAISLLTQCAAAMGSPEPLSTFYASARMVPANATDSRSDLVLRSKGDAQIRWDSTSSAGQETIVLQASEGKVKRGQEESRMAPWQTAYSRAEHFPALLCSAELLRPGMDIAYIGMENVGASTAHHIRISAERKGKSIRADAANRVISEFHLFLDAKSFLVLKTKRFAFSPEAVENRSDLETSYSDYKRIDGVWMPFTLSIFLGGQKLHDIVFENVQLGVTLNDADFSN